jgi:hypothetical protein
VPDEVAAMLACNVQETMIAFLMTPRGE